MILDSTATGTAAPFPLRSVDLNRLARITLVAGALGVASAAAVLATPPMVSPGQFSTPFTPTGHVIAQAVFAGQHVLMLAGVIGLSRLAPWSLSRRWRAGLVLAGSALVLLVGCEIFGMFAASATDDSAIAGAVSAAYGLPTVAVGIGFALAGWVVGRRRLLTWGAWLPFCFGMWVFIPLLPALMAPDVYGRLALGGWFVVYLLVGVALRRQARVR